MLYVTALFWGMTAARCQSASRTTQILQSSWNNMDLMGCASVCYRLLSLRVRTLDLRQSPSEMLSDASASRSGTPSIIPPAMLESILSLHLGAWANYHGWTSIS